MKNPELIDKYFNNCLSPKEQKLFNELLQNDQKFKMEFLFQKDLQKALAKNEQNNLKSSLQNIEKNIENKPKLMVIAKKWLVAASIVFIVGLLSILVKTSFYPSTDKIYAENFVPYRNIVNPIVRGEVSISIEYSAFLAYENGNFHKAINLFNSIENQNATYIPFYKAMCYLSLDKIVEAIDLLEPLSIESYTHSEFSEDKFVFKSEWYLGLAYLKMGEKEKAISKFSIVINQPCSECKKKVMAQEIMEFID